MLKGASEVQGATKLGAMINARGCVQEKISGKEYLIVVVWQGLNKTIAPSATCGAGLYDSDETRRAVSTIIRVAELSVP
jgi:type IV pilus assembly protein PilV